MRTGATAAATLLVLAALSQGAPGRAGKPAPPEEPSYALPNIVAVIMCAAALAIPCKRFRRT